MNKDYQLEIDALAISLTKPATRLGVPFIPFFASISLCMFGWMLLQVFGVLCGLSSALVFLFVWLCIYTFMLLKSKKDIFGLSIFFVNLMHFIKPRSFRFWGNTNSYSA